MTTRRVRIATRQSALALWQAEHVAARLRALYADLDVALVPMTTRGDQIVDQPLAAIGGKGLFLKELEVAIAEGRADLAVHSMKDVPMALEDGFAIAAVLERADPFDAFVSARAERLVDLPNGARVGTSSLRRQAQLKAVRPDLQVVDLRGNVNTRLAKLDAGLYDAVILACAGLERLGLGARIRERLTAPAWLPAVAQGAIGIECMTGRDDVFALLAPLRHAATETCVAAERAMNLKLHGSCDVPVAGFAQLAGDRLTLDALVGDAGNGRLVRASASGSAGAPEALGDDVAQRLYAGGAQALLKRH